MTPTKALPITLSVDEVIADIRAAGAGRTGYEGQSPRRDELLVGEIERLRQTNARLRQALTELAPQSPVLAEPGPRAAAGWAALDPKGQVIVNSVRATADAVRLAAGECRPIRVTIGYQPQTAEDQSAD